MSSHPFPIIFYDGLCGLCDRSVQFILRHDKRKIFRFASLQSGFAHQILGEKIRYDSFIYYENEQASYRSTAALLMFRKLGGVWSLLFAFIIIPAIIRNGVYDYVAMNRYRWYGKFDTCKIPADDLKERFLG